MQDFEYNGRGVNMVVEGECGAGLIYAVFLFGFFCLVKLVNCMYAFVGW